MPDGAPYRYAEMLGFRPADPQADAETLIAFGRDLYIQSLGDDGAFRRDYGRRGERFPRWIAACAASRPAFATLLVENDAPVGLVVMGLGPREKSAGHVHHLYVIPTHRGRGFGGLLDDYARETLRGAGCVKARLNVTARNARALRFYAAQGWRDVAPRRDARLRVMEVAL